MDASDIDEFTGSDEGEEPRYTAKQLGDWPEHVLDNIAGRVEYYRLPWWKRWRQPRPDPWRGNGRC